MLSEAAVATIGAHATASENYSVTVDLEQRRVTDDHGLDEPFTIDDAARHRLLHGLDDIGLILQYEADITAYESRLPASRY